jgi:hypothetical protein
VTVVVHGGEGVGGAGVCGGVGVLHALFRLILWSSAWILFTWC